MREVAADGPAVADLRVGDMGQGFMDQGQVPCRSGITLELAVSRERSDAQTVRSAVPHACKLCQRVNVDQHSRLRQPKIHCRNKALTPSQKMRLVAVFGLHLQGLLKGPGGNIPKGRGLHVLGRVAENGRGGTVQSMEKIAVTNQNIIRRARGRESY